MLKIHADKDPGVTRREIGLKGFEIAAAVCISKRGSSGFWPEDPLS